MASLSFNAGLGEYGESAASLYTEIKNDIISRIVNEVGSVAFSRETGFGVELYENEPMTTEERALMQFRLAQTVQNYNDGVAENRRVAFSQQYMKITDDETTGERRVTLLVVPLASLTAGNQPAALDIGVTI